MATVFERWAQTAGELKAAKATPEQVEIARDELRKRFVEKMKEAKLDSAARAAALSRFESGTNALSIKYGLKKEADPLTEDDRYAAENPVLGGITQAGKELVAPLAQGVQRIAGGAARLLNDIGDNDKGTALDRFATSMDDAQASVDDWAGQGYAEADGVRGFAKSALQNAPQIALSLLPGAALGKAASLAKAAKGAQAGAKVLKYGMPVAAGLSFGQNYAGEYGDARKQTEDKLAKASPDDLRASEVYGSDFESLERKFFEGGMSADDAAVAARDALVDSISENRADSAATINTALEFVAPGAMAVMPGFAKTGSRLASDLALAGKMASGGRFGSKAANLSDLKDVGLQFLQEGLQGGVTERVAEGARANAFNDEVNYGSVLKSAALEGLAGGIIGGGAQMASGGTSRRRAQAAVDEAQVRRKQYSSALAGADAELQRLAGIRNQRPLTEDENYELSSATMEARQARAAISEIDKMMSEAGLRAPATLSGVVQRAQASTAPDLTTVVNEAIASGQTPDFGALAQASNRDRTEVVDLFNSRRTLVELAESGDLNGMRDMAGRMTADPQEQQSLIEQAVAVRDKRRAMAAQTQQAAQQPAAPASPIKTPRDTAYEKMLADAEGAIASGASDVDTFLAIRKKYAGNKDLTETDINGVIEDAKASAASKQQAAAKRAAAIESAIPHLKAGDEVSAVTTLADAGISGDADIQAALKEASGRIKAEQKAQAAPKQPAAPSAPAKSPMEQAVAAAIDSEAAGKGVKLGTIAKKFGVGIADLAKQIAQAKRAQVNTKQPEEEKPKPPQVLALPAPQDAPIPADQPLVARRGKLMPKAQADAMAEQSAAEKRDMRRAMSEEAGNPTGVPTGMRPRVEAPARKPQKAVLPDVILRTDGKPFPNEAEATRAMNRKGAQETHEVAPAPQGSGVVVKRKQTNVIDVEKDDILAAIAKAGGVDWAQARAQGGFDPAESDRRGSGILRVFKKNGGMTLDRMAETLSQYGYPVTDENGDYTVNALLDAMDAALRGSQIGAVQFNERLAREMYEQAAEWQALDDAFDGKSSGGVPAWLDDGADALVESVIDGGIQPSAVMADALNEVENERTIASPVAGIGQETDAKAEAGSGQGGNAPAAGRREAGQQEGQGSTGQDSGVQAGFQLTAQTEAERLAEERRQAAAAEAQRKQDEQARLKAQADSELSSFNLTGSDRPADVAMAAGQNDLFAPKTLGQKEAAQAAAKAQQAEPVVATASSLYADEMFDPAEIENMRVLKFKGREKLISMKIADFLKMAKNGHDAEKETGVNVLAASGQKFSDLPFLRGDNDGDVVRITGHEGRHRARKLLEMGYKYMPVVLKINPGEAQSIRWDQQADPNRFDYVEQWPTVLEGENGDTMPFPVPREQAGESYRPENVGGGSANAAIQSLIDKTTPPQGSGGDERRAQRNAAAPDAPAIESKPEPVKWFGSRDKAEAWIAKVSKVNGGSYYVVQAGPSRFEVFARKKPATPNQINKQGNPARKRLGVNYRGETLYEDEMGVRSYATGGVLVSESVSIIPGKGIERGELTKEYKTADELAAEKGNESGKSAPTKDLDAPGTRYNTAADRAAADRLQKLLDSFMANRGTPEGAARDAIRSVIEELRKPKTTSSVESMLETASSRLMRKFPAQAEVVDGVIESLGAQAAPTEDLDAMFDDVLAEVTGREANKQPQPTMPVESAFTGSPDPKNSQPMQELDGFVVGDRVAISGRSVSEGVVRQLFKRQSSGGEMNMARVEIAGGKTLDLLTDNLSIQERTAGQAAASAAKNTGMALVDAIDGLGKLFGGNGRLSSGLTFDKETYAKAKPYFIAAISHLKAVGSDLREAMRAVIKMVVDKFGVDAAENMKPYVVQFIADVRDGKIDDPAATLNGSNTNEDAGNDVRKLDTAGQGALEGVPSGEVQGAATGRGTGSGTAEGGRGNGGADGSVAGAGSDRNGGMGNSSERVPVSGAGAGGSGRGRSRSSGGNGRAVSAQSAAGNEQESAEGLATTSEGLATTSEGLATTSEGLATDASQPSEALEPGRIDPPQLTEDFIIEDDLGLGEGGQRTKYKNNVEAIRLIRDLEATGRTATTDEQKVLAKYVGWGGIPQAFDPDNKDWSAQYAELKALLSDDEWESAKESTQYAHYTSREIINGMYAAVRRLGFTGGNVLEAGGGVGNFIGLMPVDLRTNGKVTLVEREAIAAAIAKHLYPRQNIRAEDFTEFGKGQDGQYDVQIGNPPFHSTPLTDKSGRKHLTGLSVHNYFITKGVDMLRDGGIMAVVVSNSFMDAGNVRAREYIAKRAKLLGAIRLPNNAFSKNANTQVTTDIIFLQKLPESDWNSKAAIADGKRWVGVTTVSDPQGKGEVALNQYFADNKGMMLGVWGKFGTMYGPDQPALVARPGQDTAAMMARAVAALPEGVYTPASVSRTKAMEGALLEKLHDNSVGEGGFYVRDGKVWQRVADSVGEAYAAEITPDTVISGTRPIGQSGADRLRQLAELRRTMRELLAAETEDRKADMDRLRKELNTRYDAYTADNGRINDPTTKRLMRDDPDYPLIAALEMDYEPGIGPAAAKAAGIKPQKSKAKKAAIFDRRVIEARKAVTKADSPQDAINISMAERGRLDAEYIGRLLDVPADEVLGQLASGTNPLLFRDPATDEYVLRDAYLSGNVREKLKQAKAAGLTSNARALEEVQPEDIPASKISVRIGSPWVPVGVYADFAKHLFGERTKAHLRYVKSNGSFTGAIIPESEAMASTKFGISDYHGDALLMALMNNRQIRVTYLDANGKRQMDKEATEQANSKADDIKQAFQDWVFKDSDRAEALVRAYNDANNNYVVRKYDGSWLKFPGKVPDAVIRFRRHQRNAIARTIQDRTTLYDHVVGAGKTFTAIASAMEMRRMGLIRKPLMVVPNHLVGQWASDFYRLYPGAKVLAATKKDFQRENRRRFLAKIASGDWDAVIIAHSSFERIKPNAEFEQQFTQAEIDRIMREAKEVEKSDGDEQDKKRTVKQLAAMQERLENRIAKLREKPMDDLLDFQQLGVDQVFVDEAHLFKNLMFTTKMQNVRGLGDPTGSQRAYDMYIKTNQVMDQNGRGQGVVFMTGTPVSNSLAEMYHMMRYLMPTQMRQLGFESFDAWANTSASVNQVWMQTAGGDGFKAQNRMSNFDNVPELLRLFDQVSDTVTMDDIKAAYKEETGKDFPLPRLLTGRRQPVSLEKTPLQEAYMKEIVDRLKKIEGRKGPPKKGEDNHLTVMSDARKAAMDIRLVDGSVIDRERGARVDRASDEIFARWKKYEAERGTQLVFADLGTPIGTVKNEVKEYDAIMARIAAGEDPDNIASAQLGDEAAVAKVSDAEDARAELDAKGNDWLTAIEGAKRGFSVYDDLKKALMDKGIPENQIAFIHSYNTDDQKAALFRKVNNGEIRILMGSTAKMGAGTNVQKRLVALHHLDVPWKPSDLEQREGRIIRQGNELADKNQDFEVEILAYVTKDTLDMRMWQIQEVKLKMINQLRTRNVERELENAFEDMEMSAGEMQAAATGNMDLLREIQLRTEVQKLEKKQRAFDAGKSDAIAGIRRATREIESLPVQIAAYERLTAASNAVQQDVADARARFKANINGTEYANHTEAAKVLRGLVDAVETGEDGKERKSKLDVTLNGEQFTNRQKLAEAFARLSGDNEPFVFDAGDGKVYRIDDAADAVMDTIASSRDSDGEKLLGNMGDYKVSIEYGGEKLNQDEVFEVHASLGDDDLPSAVVRAKPGDDRHAAKEILKAVRNMVRDAGSALSSLKYSLEKAKKNLADLSKIDTTSEWPDSDKLARMRDEHRRLRNKINRNDGSLSYDISFFLAEQDSGMIRVVGESGNAFSGQPAAGFSSETDAGEWIRNQLMEKITKDYKDQGIQMRLIRRDSRAYGAPEYIVTHGSQVYEPDGEYYADRDSASSFFASWNDTLESGVFTGKKKPASPVSRLKGERMDPIPDYLFSAADTSGPGLTTSSAREILSADPVLSKAMPFIDIRNSREGVPDGAEPMYLPAWHGSPYKFDKFSLEYMGKGEGNQAYGWGLYFSGAKAVAEYYRKALSEVPDNIVGFNGVDYDYSEGSPDAPALVSALVDYYGVRRQAATGVIVELRKHRNITVAYGKLYYTEKRTNLQDEILTLLNLFRNHAIGKPRGQVYRVELPGDDTYLSWDKPLSEQSKYVSDRLSDKKTAKAFGKYAIRNKGLIDAIGSGKLEGWQAYESLVIAMGSPKKASKFLNSIGISGIKYLDGAGRSKGDGNHNYVVFDDAAVRIMETLYSAGDAGAEGYYHNGRITLFADNIRATGSMSAEERLKWVAFHEITHRGVANLAESQAYLSELERAGKNPYVKNLAKKIYEARQSLDEKYHVSIEVATEEALAEINAALRTGNVKQIKEQYGLHFPLSIRPRAKSATARFFEAVKRIVNRMFGRGLTDAQVEDLLRRTNAAGMTPDGGPGRGKDYDAAVFSLADNGNGSPTEAALAEARRQLDEQLAIADRMIADRGGLFAPNGEPSKLNRMQWAQVRTANFKAWFGDWEKSPARASKVVDANGEPMVVYHGTTAMGFNEFKLRSAEAWGVGAYFASDKTMPEEEFGVDGRVIEAFLNIRKPSNGEMPKIKKSSEAMKKLRQSRPRFRGDEYDAFEEFGDFRGESIREAGHDGVIADNDEYGKEIVAFSPNQIKSATGNAGTFSPATDDIRYSPSPRDWINEQGRITKRVFSKEVAQRDLSLWQKTLGTQLNAALKNPAFKKVYDLTQRLIQHVNNDAYDSLNAAPDVLSRLEDWSDYKRDLGNTAKEAGSALMLRQSKRRKDMTAAAEVLFEGTRFDKKVYSDKELDAFGLTAAQKEIYRQARAAIDKSVGNAGKSQALNVAMNAKAINWTTVERLVNMDLDPEVLFGEVSDLIITRIAVTKMEADNSTSEAEIKMLSKQVEKMVAALAAIGEIQSIVEKSAAEGYAPLMRWGKYTVAVIDPVDGKTLRFHMLESKREQAALELQLREKYGDANVVGDVLDEGKFEQFKGITPETVALFASVTGMDQDAAYQEYLKLAIPGRSALKRKIHRKGDMGEGIEGFSTDLPRVLSSFVLSNARKSARDLYRGPINDAIKGIKVGGGVAAKARELAEFVLEPDENDWLVGIRNLLFVWNMGASVAFGVLNLSQPWMMTLPWLSQFQDPASAAGVMAKAAKLAASAQASGKAPKGYEAEYSRAVREGIVDPQNVFMLQGVERGKSGVGSNIWRNVAHGMGLIAAATESMNRKLTLIAALDVARAKGDAWLKSKGFADAYDFAARSVAETQGVYNKGNRPAWARNPALAVILVFKQYSINWVEMASRMASNHYGDDRYRKGFWMLIGALFMMAGGMGLPFAEDLIDLIETGMSNAGKPVNIERQMQMTLGKDLYEPLMNGPVNSLLFNAAGADMFGRMSMGNLIPATAIGNTGITNTARAGEIMEAAGAGAGLASKFADAYNEASAGNIGRALITASPRAFTSAAKAVEMATTGEYKDSKGRNVRDVTPAEALIKGLDLQPASVARIQRERSRRFKDEAIQAQAKDVIRGALIDAYESDDRAAIDEAERKLEEWNRENPLYPVRINRRNLRKTVRERGKNWSARDEAAKGMEWMDEWIPEKSE